MESGCTFSRHWCLERRNKRNGQCLQQGLRRGEKVQGPGDGGDVCNLESKSETGARVWPCALTRRAVVLFGWFFCFVWLPHTACRVLVPSQRTGPRALGNESPECPNHWTAGELPGNSFAEEALWGWGIEGRVGVGGAGPGSVEVCREGQQRRWGEGSGRSWNRR